MSACASQPAPAAPPPEARVAATPAERFLPLVDGTVFAYETEADATGERGMLVLETRRPRPGRADLVVAGQVTRLEIDASGIRYMTGGWLLKDPLEVGKSFQGSFGQVRVSAVDREVTTPAGTFHDCLETVESASGTDFTKVTTTIFCPGVGLTTRRTEVDSNEGSGAESIRLKSHGPRVDVNAL